MSEGLCAGLLRVRYGPEQIAPLESCRADRRCTTSLRLPEMLALREKGYSYSKIGKELQLSKRQVEHVLRQHTRG
jgi:hypothetical protein